MYSTDYLSSLKWSACEISKYVEIMSGYIKANTFQPNHVGPGLSNRGFRVGSRTLVCVHTHVYAHIGIYVCTSHTHTHTHIYTSPIIYKDKWKGKKQSQRIKIKCWVAKSSGFQRLFQWKKGYGTSNNNLFHVLNVM